MSHFVQNDADIYCLACCDVKCYEFRLSGQRHDALDYVRNVKDDSVVGRYVNVVGEEEVTACSDFCLEFVEVADNAVDSEGYVAC